MTKKLLSLALTLILLLGTISTGAFSAAVADPAQTGNLASESYTMDVGEKLTLYLGATGVKNKSVQWESNDSAISIISGYNSSFSATVRCESYVSYRVIVTCTITYEVKWTVGGVDRSYDEQIFKNFYITINKPAEPPSEQPTQSGGSSNPGTNPGSNPTSTEYTITFDPANGYTSNNRYYRSYGESFTFPSATSNTAGYVFSHWADNFGNTYTAGSQKTVYGNQYYTAVYKVNRLTAPVLTKVANTVSGVQITWKAVSGAGLYRVYMKNGSSWTKLGDTYSTSYIHKTAVSGKKYTYTVKCITSTGVGLSGFNTTGKSIVYVKAPSGIKITNTAYGAKLTWTKSAGAYKYRVYIKVGSVWKNLADTRALSYIHRTAKQETKYTYTVRCLNAASAAVSAYNTTGWSHSFMKPGTVLKPVITKFQNVLNGTSITWTKRTGASKYRVYVKSGSAWKCVALTSATTFTYKNVVGGKKYTYTVRCFNGSGKTAISAYDTVGKSYVFIKAPSGIKATATTNGGIKVTWNKSAGAVKYRVFIKTAGTSWQALADTTALSYTYYGGTAYTKYSFTVRCVSANGKAYHSYVDTTGVSITKPADDPGNTISTLPAIAAGKYRYLFWMPDGKSGPKDSSGKYIPTWYVDGTTGPVFYPFTAYGNSSFEGIKADAPNVYYFDAVKEEVMFCWFNHSTMKYRFSTTNIGSEYYDPGDSPLYPNGVPNFNNMIYILDPNKHSNNSMGGQNYGGEWYYYYGNGCYGTVKNGAGNLKACCLNPDHNHL